MEQRPAEPTTFRQAQGISNRIGRETENDYAAVFAESVETMRVADFLTDTESEEMTALFTRQSGLVARMSDDVEAVDALAAEEVESALEHVRASITGALKFDGAAKEVLTEAKEIAERELEPEDSTLINHLHERNLPAFESMARWSTMSRAVLRHAGIVLTLVGISMVKLMPKDQSGASMKSRLGTDNLQGLDRKVVEANLLPEDPQDTENSGDTPTPQLELPEALIPILRDRNVDIGEVLPSFTLSFVRTYKAWQKAGASLPETLETFGDVSQAPQKLTESKPEPTPAPQELSSPQNEELQALIAAHVEQASDFRPSWAQMQRLGLRPFANTLRQMGRAGELAGVGKELPADTAKRLTGLLHVAEEFGQNPAALRERLVTLVHDEYIAQVNIDRILENLRTAGVQQSEPDWLPVTRDFDLLLANWKTLEPKLLESWSPAPNRTHEEAAAAIGASLQAFRKARFEVKHPERRLARIAKPLGAVALPPDAKPEQSYHTSSRQNQAVIDTLRAIAASETTTENKRMRARVLLHFVNLAESQRQEGGEEGFGDVRHSDPIDSGKRYYTIKFRNPYDDSEWHLLESFEPETATWVIPDRLVQDYGSLKELVRDFGKDDQRDFGSVQTIHVKGWTPESHIEHILRKIKPENGVNEPAPLDEIASDEGSS